MRELTPEQRTAAMTATAEAFNKVFNFAHDNGWDEKFYFDFQYLFHGYEDKVWFTMWGVIGSDKTAVNMNVPNLYARWNDTDSDYLRQFAVTPENILNAADICIGKMQDFIANYNVYIEAYLAEKEDK